MKYTIAIICLLGITLSLNSLNAQSKIGYLDENYVVGQLPDYKTAQEEMKNYQQQIQDAITEKQKELEAKSDDFKAKQQNGSLTPALADSKMREMKFLEQQLIKLQQSAQQDMAQKESELLNPIYQKVETTIKEVAKTNGYDYVLRSEFVYNKIEANNISNLVLKKMGVTPTSQGN